MLNWLEIDRRVLQSNMTKLRKWLGQEVKVMAVVKANAYGHGLVPVAEAFARGGADYFAVANLEEAIALRKAGIRLPILVLGYIEAEGIHELFEYDVIPSIYNLEIARTISHLAQRHGKPIRVHVKIDTGMHRLGFFPGEFLELLPELGHLPGIEVEAIYSHFANVPDREYSEQQYRSMMDVLFRLQRLKSKIPMVHMANSQATFLFSKARFDMVRVGRVLYGSTAYADDLLPSLSFKTRVGSIKVLPKGVCVGYGSTYTTSKETRVAVLSVGYADGYGRHLSNKGVVLVRGRRCPVIGRICMNQTMVDVTVMGDLRAGEEVVLVGEQAEDRVTIEEIAAKMETTAYEVMARIPEHVPRIYLPN